MRCLFTWRKKKGGCLRISITGFIDGSGGPNDWDWVMTGPKESQDAERVSSLCASLDVIHPPKQKGHFTDDAGLAVLQRLIVLLRSPGAGDSRVSDFVDEAIREIEPDGTAKAAQ